MLRKCFGFLISGILAGTVTGLLGAGGGMILVPALTLLTDLHEDEIFPASVAIILPICIISILMLGYLPPWNDALPYLVGSVFGGIFAGIFAGKIPVVWLHRSLGALILWGGIRYLW